MHWFWPFFLDIHVFSSCSIISVLAAKAGLVTIWIVANLQQLIFRGLLIGNGASSILNLASIKYKLRYAYTLAAWNLIKHFLCVREKQSTYINMAWLIQLDFPIAGPFLDLQTFRCFWSFRPWQQWWCATISVQTQHPGNAMESHAHWFTSSSPWMQKEQGCRHLVREISNWNLQTWQPSTYFNPHLNHCLSLQGQ